MKKDNEQDKQIEKMSHHVEIMNQEFGDFKISNTSEHSAMKTDLEWLKKHYYIVAGASVGGLATAFFNLLK